MRLSIGFTLCLGGALVLAGCERMSEEEVERAVASVDGVNVIDESNLAGVMMSAADPDEAVAYFRRTHEQYPNRADVTRGLAQSLVRAKKPAEGARYFSKLVESGQATPADRVALADALIRAGNWSGAKDVLNQIPPTFETYDRYRLEAMVADSNKDWDKADSFYQTAVGLTTQPSRTYNNWGFSKLSRGDFKGAEALFLDALKYDPSMYTAKNNLMLARGGQRKYDIPAIAMTQVERARLLHTLALAAIKQGDVAMGKTLLEEAIATHPQHFDEAVRSLRVLEADIQRG